MSHEIRTPLNAILGLVQLLRRDVAEPVAADRLGRVEEASRHLQALIDDILDLSRIEAGKLAIEPADFELPALLERVQALLVERARDKGLELQLQLGPLPARVRSDPTRLMQALLNPAGNAVKFTEHGRVAIAAQAVDEKHEGWRVRFEVSDTGPGLPCDGQQRLFQPFEQGDVSTTRRHGGSGLGLAITQQVAEALGGQLSLTSTPGDGTCAVLEVPLQRPAQPKRRARQPTPRRCFANITPAARCCWWRTTS
ncbi:HAMP domain-containing histidine kinase [Piscinibacter aquaticus]|uniref:Virulence sensor protein BvgS n=1 Tax=Piscinibacter aquaticus TaxID=392597 RepID=A0A5C6TZX8_9BURK|nr:HAMP domain-containing histidine kinase [Piscinibacter aquaticus]